MHTKKASEKSTESKIETGFHARNIEHKIKAKQKNSEREKKACQTERKQTHSPNVPIR